MKYTDTIATWTPKDREAGEPSERETNDEKATFREMMDLLRTATPSRDPIPEDGCETYYFDFGINEGSREWYEKGIVKTRCIFPNDKHAARWMRRAYLATHNGKAA